MAKPPTPTQRTYRGRIRADMRSAYNHLIKLNRWNNKYLSGPVTNYPNQLYLTANGTPIDTAAEVLFSLLASLGPIPLTRG